ncbi:MAG: serine hydrolase domain-containing protein [Spirosomataceae bacterium]
MAFIILFSCNNTTSQQQAHTLHNALVDCVTDTSRTPEEVAKLKKDIEADEKSARLDSLFQRKFKLERFNGNVLIAQKGVILYRNSFGYAQVERKDTLRSESKFQLASLSKTFTAVAILKLYEEGKLSLEDSVQKFIPELPYSGIKIKSLLAHRSGLPNYAYIVGDSIRKRNPYPTNEDIVRWYCAFKPKLYNIPNSHFSYSNTNYAFLATIVEKVSGQAFEDYLKQIIFKPLGMKNTWLVTSRNDSLNQFRTVGYQYNRRLAKDNFDDVVGDKGVYSTMDDIFRWYAGLNGGCVLRPETMREAFTPRSFERHGIKNYGYGFRMHVDEATRQPKYVYHTGWWKGYNTLMWFSPKDKFVIILLSNRYNRSIYQIKPILEILEGKNQVNEEVEEEIF